MGGGDAPSPKRSLTMVTGAAAQLRQTGHSCIMQPLQVASEGRAEKHLARS